MKTEWSKHWEEKNIKQIFFSDFFSSLLHTNESTKRNWRTKTDISSANHKKRKLTCIKNNTHKNYSIDLYTFSFFFSPSLSTIVKCDELKIIQSIKAEKEKKADKIRFSIHISCINAKVSENLQRAEISSERERENWADIWKEGVAAILFPRNILCSEICFEKVKSLSGKLSEISYHFRLKQVWRFAFELFCLHENFPNIYFRSQLVSNYDQQISKVEENEK